MPKKYEMPLDEEEDEAHYEQQQDYSDEDLNDYDQNEQADQVEDTYEEQQQQNGKHHTIPQKFPLDQAYNHNGFQQQNPSIQASLAQPGIRKIRPQSAKTGSQQPGWLQQPGQQYIPQPGLVSGYSHTDLLPSGAKAAYAAKQTLNGGNYFYQPAQLPPKVARKRPGTAGRKSKHIMNVKHSIGGGNAVQIYGNQNSIVPSMAKSVAMEAEVLKLRPRIVQQEREQLFDDVLKQRMATNSLINENTKLRTRMQMTENELSRKDKMIDELLHQQQDAQAGNFKSSRAGKESHHLVVNLKRKIRDQHVELMVKADEVELLKRNIKNTRTHETELEIKMYMDECVRLRQQLEEVIKSKDTFADPQELSIIEHKFQQRDMVIAQQQQENQQLVQELQRKDEENRQLAGLAQEMERRMRKAQSSVKQSSRTKTALKESEREIHKMRKDILELRDQNKALQNKVAELQMAASNRPSYSRPQTSTVQVASVNPQQQQELKKLQQELESKSQLQRQTQNDLAKAKKELGDKKEELAIALQDRTRFKELSEKYMQEVARLEAQLEEADVKPKRGSQRPKDTVKREHSATQNSNAVKTKRVEAKLLTDVVHILKLKLQEQELTSMQMQNLFFAVSTDSEVSIAQLKTKFENLGVKPQKALLLARYIVEPKSGGDVVFNEQAGCQQREAVDVLYDLIGPYKIYSEMSQGVDFVADSKMQKMCVEKFGKHRQALRDALACEDYEESGILELTQVREAIVSVEEDVDDHLMDWMLYYIYSRSDTVDRMEYQVLIRLLDDALKQQKKRPESSNHEKVKANQGMVQQVKSDSYSEDRYSSDPQIQDDIKPKDSYEESPRVREAEHEDEELDVDEDQMIDVAEKIFVKLADQIIQLNVTIRQVFQPHIFPAEIDGDAYELLSAQGLLEGIRDLDIDLQEIEEQCLLKVLSKPELDGHILMQEFLQIMENFGLYDDGQQPQSEQESEHESEQPQKEQKKKQLDLSRLDQKSVKIMVMLMLFLLENNMTTAQFFEECTYQQNVKSKNKQQTLDILKAEDFFRVLQERGIRKKNKPHQNLQTFLQLSPAFPELLVLKSVRKTLEQMAENEEFMDAIRQDLLAAEGEQDGEEQSREGHNQITTQDKGAESESDQERY